MVYSVFWKAIFVWRIWGRIMGRIAGTVGEEFGAAAMGASGLLKAVGVANPMECRGFAATDASQFATLGSLRLVLDGAIYNPEEFPEQGPGGDAGRVLAAIDRHGLVATLKRINGDFALAMVDDSSGELSLARDRFGVRPLYHTAPGAPIGFASRPRSLLMISGISREIDPNFLLAAAATHYRFVDGDPTRSPFRDIVQVPAGHVVMIANGTVERTRFADITAGPPPGGTARDQAEEYHDLLKDSVERRLRHARNPVFTLSGGLDSSTVTALAHRITGSPPAAISSVHEDETYDERKEIMDVVNAGLVDWQPVQIDDPDLFSLISEISAFHDQPIPTVTWMSHYLLGTRIAELGYESVFGGLGGDEQHAGEYDYFFYFFADLKAAGRTDLLEQEIKAWIRNHDHPVFRKSAEVADRVMAIVTEPDHPGLCRGNTDLLYRYRGLLNPDLGDLSALAPRFEASSPSYLASHMRNELLFNTMPCCLRAADRNATALGLREFHPFLDWRLFEFMLALPSDRKIQNGLTKCFAREAYKGLLPEATRIRVKKTGWNAPAHQWFAGPGSEPVMDMVASRQFRERGIYDVPAVQALLKEHQDIVDQPRGRDDHMMVLWQIVTLELWLRSVEDIPRSDI
jgi:asparagine synthase (glutamine-hydrolysing)